MTRYLAIAAFVLGTVLLGVGIALEIGGRSDIGLLFTACGLTQTLFCAPSLLLAHDHPGLRGL
jgi:hypothetical protein